MRPAAARNAPASGFFSSLVEASAKDGTVDEELIRVEAELSYLETSVPPLPLMNDLGVS